MSRRPLIDETRRALRIHLWFAVPSAVLLPIMLFTGKTGRKSTHVAFAVAFGLLWTGTFVTGVFFSPTPDRDHDGRRPTHRPQRPHLDDWQPDVNPSTVRDRRRSTGAQAQETGDGRTSPTPLTVSCSQFPTS